MIGTHKKQIFTRGAAPWIALSLLLALTGCEKPVAKVGAVLPLTGPDAAVGEAAQRGLEASLAALGETPLTLEVVDSESNPEVAAAAAKALIDGGAVALVGGVTPGEARGLAEAADASERVIILTSATEQHLSQDSKWVYRLASSDAEAGATFATFAARRFKTQTAAILASDAAYASAVEAGFKPTFTSLDGELIATLDADTAGLEATVGELVALAPDLAVLSGDAEWQRAAADQLRSQGFRGHLFASRHLAHPGVADAVAPIKDLLFAHSVFDPAAPREGIQGFLDGYTAHHGSAPDGMTAQVS
ncbi:MAG: ABC transporter substrate-binding protein, partial [Acidobacteriota bacterium]